MPEDLKNEHEEPIIPGNEKVGDFVVAPDDLYDKETDKLFDLSKSVEVAMKMIDDRNEQIKLINQQRELEAEKGRHDPLTNLLNRRGLIESYTDLFNSHSRKSNQVEGDKRQSSSSKHVFARIDLDKFKAVNDTHEHRVGDETLKYVAAILKDSLRSGDLVARIGGDEFAILLENTEEENAELVMNRIKNEIAEIGGINMGVNGEYKPISIGASIGIVYASPDFSETDEKADAACYQAKKDGRGRVVVFEKMVKSED